MSNADDEAAARRYRAWCTVHDRRIRRRYQGQLDEELEGTEEVDQPRVTRQITYPVVYHTAPGELYDEQKDRFYRG